MMKDEKTALWLFRKTHKLKRNQSSFSTETTAKVNSTAAVQLHGLMVPKRLIQVIHMTQVMLVRMVSHISMPFLL